MCRTDWSCGFVQILDRQSNGNREKESLTWIIGKNSGCPLWTPPKNGNALFGETLPFALEKSTEYAHLPPSPPYQRNWRSCNWKQRRQTFLSTDMQSSKHTHQVVLVKQKPSADVWPNSVTSVSMTSSTWASVAMTSSGNSQICPDACCTTRIAEYLRTHTKTLKFKVLFSRLQKQGRESANFSLSLVSNYWMNARAAHS